MAPIMSLKRRLTLRGSCPMSAFVRRSSTAIWCTPAPWYASPRPVIPASVRTLINTQPDSTSAAPTCVIRMTAECSRWRATLPIES